LRNWQAMARKIIAYILVAIGVLAALFFKGNAGDMIPYAPCFFICSNIIWVIGVLLLFTMPSLRKIKEQQSLKALIDSCKKNGDCFTVDLTKCRITEHSYTSEHESRTFFEDIAITDLERFMPDEENVVWDKTSKVKMDNIIQSVIIYEQEVNGVHRKFVSQIINKDKATLMFLLDEQMKTTIYYDRSDPSKCYFDLDFLNK
jgi:hypothetical protein